MVTQSSGIAEIMRRLAALETRVDRLHRVGKVTEADYENLVFTVQPLEDGSPAPLTGVRCLYTRMHPHLTEFALPEKDEIVRLEELNKNSYVITGSYGHNVVEPDVVTVPLYAYGAGRDREAVPREIHAVGGAIQLRSRSNIVPNAPADENAFVYVGQIGVRFGDAEQSYGVVMSHLGLSPFPNLERTGTELIVGPLGVAVRNTAVHGDGVWKRADFDVDHLVLVTTDRGTAGVTLDPIESDDSEPFATEQGGSNRTGSGGNPSHSHSVPDHSHEVPPHVHPLPIRKTTQLRVNDNFAV